MPNCRSTINLVTHSLALMKNSSEVSLLASREKQLVWSPILLCHDKLILRKMDKALSRLYPSKLIKLLIKVYLAV